MDLMTETAAPSAEWLEDHIRHHATSAELDTWPICKAYQLTSRRLRDEAEALQQQHRELIGQQGLDEAGEEGVRQQGVNALKGQGMPSHASEVFFANIEALLSRIRCNEAEQRLAERSFLVSSHHGLEVKDCVLRALRFYPLR